MKRNFLLLALLGVMVVSACFGQDQLFTYHFKKPTIHADDLGFSEIVFEECYSMAPAGSPLLPLYGADLLLPQGEEIVSVKVQDVIYSEMLEGVKILPAGQQVPISKGPGPDWKLLPDEKIYSQAGPYPDDPVSHVSTGYLAGHSIGSFSVCPVVYYPSSNRVKFITSITVQVITAPSAKATEATAMLRSTPVILGRIERIVENADALKSYVYPENKSTSDVDILLISKTLLLPDFGAYINYKRSTGYIVETISTETIYATYTGQDEQAKIRNCIKDYYDNHNLQFVLLGGDADPNSSTDKIIPHRGFYAIDDTDIPADMYYCCLDGTWNNDGDNRWGEPGETDLYAEVGIGRICVDGTTEIVNFTNKLKKYQDAPVVADIKKAMMVGELLNSNPLTYGDTYKEEIVNGCSLHGFTTAWMPIDYLYTKLYDSQGSWSKTDVFQAFNTTGVNLLNHLGHSNVDYNMKMYNSDVTTTNFTNNGVSRGYPIGYSQGCYNGSFDNRNDGGSYESDCFAEAITNLSTGEVACIANSRYGWYAPGNTNSSSQFHDRQFFDAIFGEAIFHIGTVNSDAKEDNASFFNGDEYMRWTVYETNLFGDPTLDIWTNIPTAINASYPAGTPLGGSQIQFMTDAPFARIGLVQNGNLIGRAVADASGDVMVVLFDPIIVPDPITVSIIAHNRTRHQGTIQVITNQPFVVFNSYTVHDASGNNNGQVDFGETIQLGTGIKNIGNVAATNVVATLSTQDAYCTITDATETYGNLAAGEVKFIDNAFAFTTANNIPDQHTILFLLTATGDSTWTSNFSITANAPAFTLGNFTIQDPGGNNNGVLDPGETANILISTTNDGHCAAPACMASLSSAGLYITLNSSTCDLGTLAAGQTAQATFSITADASAPMGSLSPLDYQVVSGSYNAQKQYPVMIGLNVEDFETGNLAKFEWETGGGASWTVVNTNPYEGQYCAKSGSIGNNAVTTLAVQMNIPAAGPLSFYRKVSSEQSYDFLRFLIDGAEQGAWSGEVAWGQVSFQVPAGNHVFTWSYTKDANTVSGSDCAWVDYILFPANAPLVPTAVPYYTNFDLGGALPSGWQNALNDNFDWTVRTGGTPTSNTGPSGDHTTGSGYYLYTEASSPNNPNKTANLVSPLFDLSSLADVNVHFWYHMYGAAMGSLHLDVYDNGTWVNDVMPAISGNQGNQWLEKVVDLTAYAGKLVKFRFRGITGTGSTSDMAIDDFTIQGTLADMQVNLKAFLEGPFNGTVMNNNLNALGYIPLSQPFNTAPWNYTGTEAVTAIPNVNVTDWVLVELRETSGNASTATSSTMVGRKAGFILNNGTIVDVDGTSPLTFGLTVTQNLYAVVWHRNHLGVMSAVALLPSGLLYSFDFTSGANQAYGGITAHKQLASGIWGMRGGDGDSNGQINNGDKVDVWTVQSGGSGYLKGDFNLDAQVNNADKVDVWNMNSGMGTQVPD